MAATLVEAGYGDLNVLKRVDPGVLSNLKGVGKKKAISIIEEAKNPTEVTGKTETSE